MIRHDMKLSWCVMNGWLDGWIDVFVYYDFSDVSAHEALPSWERIVYGFIIPISLKKKALVSS